ncbi:MAG: nitroreductase family protein [Lutibacter sp.]|uniref:nitroreductase family protein n=1 Tax=Lutibacter sp. TaxID=1925666 RepID=UPI00181BBE70|nr:nitroreductase family protein [Lutibacter sp.]MBT8317421.1 nitroreductase family protein [Lutibacter sp.]NNJ58280.1 nitroreductase family protein [Lutibacter sp.]
MEKDDFILVDGYKHIRHTQESYSENEMLKKTKDYFNWLNKRRSVRDFSNKLIPREVIENIIKTASTAPSGAHKQPWTFCVVANPQLKKKIRMAAEEEERRSYKERMSDEWLEDLKHLGTNADKPFLEIAPYLIIVFKRPYEINNDGTKRQNYYVNESVGLACGFLISAIHNAGLVTLTHTPSPMRFLEKILERPTNERAFLLLPVGYEAEKAYVPDIQRKSIDDIMSFY